MKTISKKVLKENLSIKRAPSIGYNKIIYKKSNSSKIDLEKAHYEAELLLEEGDYYSNLEKQIMFESHPVNIFKFHYHLFEPIDWLYLTLTIIGCIICGLSNPIMTYLNADVFSKVGNTSENRSSLSQTELMKLKVKETMNTNIKKQLIYGSIALVGNFIGYSFIGLIGIKSLYNFKKKYFNVILSQEQGWFDSTDIFQFATKIQSQIEYIELGIGEGLGKVVISCFNAGGSFIFAFFGSWKLTLVIFSLFPLSLLITIIMNIINIKGNTLVKQTWEEAGGIGEEIFYNIKTVASFANFDYELKRFYEKVEISYKIELLVNLKIRICSAAIIFIGGLITFLGFIYGRTLIKKDFNSFRGRDVTGGDVFLTFNCMFNLMGTFAEISSNIQYVQLALAMASDYFSLYERKPQMDLSNSIDKPPLSRVQGKIEFNKVSFYYPSNPNRNLVLKDMNLTFEPGKKIALIGHSGCGKTTIVNLIERLYDITAGEILLDGLDIRKYDIQYLRNLIGYVEQEPVLFNRSIRENIIFGREKYLKESGKNMEELIQTACNEAYVSEFINGLPQGLDYIVGIKGNRLSGGQKQRIAIARAILIKPKILILDEATSALDNKSEIIFQKALDNISKRKITTIIIAHKLSTIKNADLIYVLKDGNILEQGIHEQLLEKNGYYANIIRSQLLKEESEIENKKDENFIKTTSSGVLNTNEEVKFENRINEISKTPENVSLGFCTIFKDLWNHKLDLILACLSATLLGVCQPFKGYINGKATKGMNSIYQTIRYDNSLKYGWIYLLLVFIESIIYFLNYWKFFDLGIELTKLYRNKMMKQYLSFHMSYYDLDINSPGSILTKMSLNTIQIKEFIRSIIGISIICFAIIITSLIVGCCYEYRLTLITILFLPFIMFINIMRRLLMKSDNKKSIQSNIEGGGILSECILNSKTIFCYNFKPEAIHLYTETIEYVIKQQIRDSFINGLILGITFFSDFCKNAAIFAATKHYVLNDTLNTDQMSVVQTIISGSSKKIDNYMRDIGHVRKAIESIKSVYSTFETKSLIPPYLKDNINKLSSNNIKGKIEFRNVYFAYPTNPEHIILKDINMTIMPGQKIALVGYSGSGKSSIIQLLERFYDVEEGKGEILIDDINIKNYNLYELRKKIGLVSQEPSIFKKTNLENIRYGNLNAMDDACILAAEEANIEKILKNDEKEELLNEKNNKKKFNLSGGEKQRLAIARIFLKNPVILLLDEVTSALDKESEYEVQKSLDKISLNKTTITITHRLNYIKNCDKIYLFDNGRIREQGTHEELMTLRKRYYNLYKYQNL